MACTDPFAEAAGECVIELAEAAFSQETQDTQPELVQAGANPLSVARSAVKFTLAQGGSQKEKATKTAGPGPGRGIGNRKHFHSNLRPVSPEISAWAEVTVWITPPPPKNKSSKKRKLSSDQVPITIWPQYSLQGTSFDKKYVVVRRSERWLQEIQKVVRPKGAPLETCRAVEAKFNKAIHTMLAQALKNAGVDEVERRNDCDMEGIIDGRRTLGKSQTASGFKIMKKLCFEIEMCGHELVVLNSARALIFEISPAAKRFMQEGVPKLFADLFANRRAGRIAMGVSAFNYVRVSI